MTSLTWKRLGLVLWLKLLQVATSGFWNTSLLSKQLLAMCLSLSYAKVKLTLGSCCFAIAVLLCLWGFWCVCVCADCWSIVHSTRYETRTTDLAKVQHGQATSFLIGTCRVGGLMLNLKLHSYRWRILMLCHQNYVHHMCVEMYVCLYSYHTLLSFNHEYTTKPRHGNNDDDGSSSNNDNSSSLLRLLELELIQPHRNPSELHSNRKLHNRTESQ